MSCTLTQAEFACLMTSPPVPALNMYEAAKSIVSSPYPDHILDLSTLDESSKELAILLQELRPNEGYLDLSYEHAFNWSTILPKLPPSFPAMEFYLVVFRSHLAVSSVSPELLVELYTHDKLSHLEASESGGLLKYWFGAPAFDGRNLATCVWINKDWAWKASRLPQHVKAKSIVWRGVYESWTLETYKLHVGGGEKWSMERIG